MLSVPHSMCPIFNSYQFSISPSSHPEVDPRQVAMPVVDAATWCCYSTLTLNFWCLCWYSIQIGGDPLDAGITCPASMKGFFKSMPRVEPRVNHSFPGDAIYQLVDNTRETLIPHRKTVRRHGFTYEQIH